MKVATADPARLREVLAGPGVEITGRPGSEELQVTGLTARAIGLKAAEHGIALFELSAKTVSLEQAFMDLTRGRRRVPRPTTGIRPPGGRHEHRHRDPARRHPAEAGAAQAAHRLQVTGRRVLRSEWAKLWSLRSTWITLGLGLLFLLAFGLIAACRYKSRISSGQPMDPDFADATAVSLALFGTNFAQLALGVLGVLVTAGEYSTGMIRSTLAAVPRRLPVLWSKAAVYGVVAFVVGAAGALVAFLFGSGVVSGTPAAMGLSDAGVLRGLLGAGLYLGLVGVIGVALGALLRSIAGGISVAGRHVPAGPGLMSLLPSSWQNDISAVPAQQRRRVDLRPAPRRGHPVGRRRTAGLPRLDGAGARRRRVPAGAHGRLIPTLCHALSRTHHGQVIARDR